MPYCVCEKGWRFLVGAGGTKCERCPPGTANSTPISICKRCGVSTFSAMSGMESCKTCPFGFNQLLQGQSKCVRDPPCPKGLVRKLNRGCVDPVTNCPPNHRRVPLIDSLPRCEPLSSVTCPGNTVPIRDESFGNEISWGLCFQNRRYEPRTRRCVVCRNNEVSPGGTSQSCTPCPIGTVAAFDGRCVCLHGHMLVRGKCVPCARGTFGFRLTDGCMPCPAGTFTGAAGSVECQNCCAGFFTDAPGQETCKRCPSGFVSSGIGDSGCVRPLGSSKTE